MSKEAMKLALKKFTNMKELCDKHGEKINRKHVYGSALVEYFDVVCQALTEQPAQREPVVFYRCNGCGHAYEQVHPTSCDCMEAGGFDRVEYYTSPQAQRTWVGLTDDEILYCVELENPKAIAEEVEAKLRERNT